MEPFLTSDLAGPGWRAEIADLDAFAGIAAAVMAAASDMATQAEASMVNQRVSRVDVAAMAAALKARQSKSPTAALVYKRPQARMSASERSRHARGR